MSGFADDAEIWQRFDLALNQAAQEISRHGSRVVCRHCGNTIVLAVGNTEGYLRMGWPQCHGETMLLRGPAFPPARAAEDTKK